MSNAYLSKGFEKKDMNETLAQMAGSSQTYSKTRAGAPVRTQVGAPQTLSSVSFANEGALVQAITDLTTERGGNCDWILLDYTNANTISMTKKGKGMGMPPMAVANDLEDNKVQFLLLAVQQGIRTYAMMTWEGNQKANATHKRELHGWLSKHFMTIAKTQLASGELRC